MHANNRARAILPLAAAASLLSLTAVGQDLFVYPANGQSDKQLANDRYECHRWAVQESGFDPTEFGGDPPRIVTVPQNEASGATEKGAAAGAIAGAVLGHGEDKFKNAVIGAVVGSIVGGAVEQSGELEAQQQARQQAEQIAKSDAEKALQRSNYRRAITACLEGRGYAVR